MGRFVGAPPLFSEYFAQYLVRFSRVRHRKSTTDLHTICGHKLTEFVGDVPIDRITDALIDDYMAWRKGQNVGNRTINIEVGVLAKALRVAVRWGVIENLPFKRIERLDEGPVRVRFLEPESRARLLSAAGKYHDMVLFFLCSGLRRGELKNLKWNDVDFNQGGIWVRDSKVGTARFIPLGASGIEILRRQAKIRRLGCENVFWNPVTGKAWADLSHVIKKILRKSGLSNWSTHDLRHAFASHLHEHGAGLYDLMQVLGHKSTEVTKRYVHPTQSRLGSLLQKADKDLQTWGQMEFEKKI